MGKEQRGQCLSARIRVVSALFSAYLSGLALAIAMTALLRLREHSRQRRKCFSVRICIGNGSDRAYPVELVLSEVVDDAYPVGLLLFEGRLSHSGHETTLGQA